MDPNESLKTCRARSADLIRILDAGHDDDGDWIGDTDSLIDASDQLAESFRALDGWINRGGFLPSGWSRA